MTDSIESSSTTKVPFARNSNNSATSGGELENIQVAYRLNGKKII